MIGLPCCNEGEKKNCETNDGDVQAILFAFEMVKSVDWYLANLLNQMEKAKKSNADGEDAGSDEQRKETIKEKTKLFVGWESGDNCVERELAVKPLLQSFTSVLLEVAVTVPGKVCLFMFSKLLRRVTSGRRQRWVSRGRRGTYKPCLAPSRDMHFDPSTTVPTFLPDQSRWPWPWWTCWGPAILWARWRRCWSGGFFQSRLCPIFATGKHSLPGA